MQGAAAAVRRPPCCLCTQPPAVPRPPLRCREDPRSAWGATFLCWLKQEVGLARVLVNGLGLETVVKVDHAVQVCAAVGCAGEDVRCLYSAVACLYLQALRVYSWG